MLNDSITSLKIDSGALCNGCMGQQVRGGRGNFTFPTMVSLSQTPIADVLTPRIGFKTAEAKLLVYKSFVIYL